jgi:hypothetical protein
LNARYRYSKLRFNIELHFIMTGTQAKILSDQQARSLLVFPSSTRSIQTTQRYLDGVSGAQRKLPPMI